MPELPEVETLRCGLASALANRTIKKAIIRRYDLRWPVCDELPSLVAGQTITTVNRRGKYLIVGLPRSSIIFHLGMSGQLLLKTAAKLACKHDHADFILDNNQKLTFNDPRRFGCILWTEAPVCEHKLLANLGPEPLTADFSNQYLFKSTRRRQAVIKNLIMNSRIVVGVGNIYASEALFLAKISPFMPSGRLSQEQCTALVASIKTILKAAIKHGGTTFRDFRNHTGATGDFSKHLGVYNRAGEPCYICGNHIKSAILGQRNTYYCPICQKTGQA